jgi:hypothetical protein
VRGLIALAVVGIAFIIVFAVVWTQHVNALERDCEARGGVLIHGEANHQCIDREVVLS